MYYMPDHRNSVYTKRFLHAACKTSVNTMHAEMHKTSQKKSESEIVRELLG